MAGTLHMQICKAAAQLLTAALANVCNGGVHKGKRGRAMAEQFSRQVHVYLDVASPERAQLTLQPNDWLTRIRIECSARTGDGFNDADDNADDLARLAYSAIAAVPNLNLPDSVSDLIPMGLKWDTEEGDTQLAVVQVVFDARHRTESDSIAAP